MLRSDEGKKMFPYLETVYATTYLVFDLAR
jgi:hypothetical protein